MRVMKLCSVPDCGAAARTRGLCQKHYMRTRRHGDPDATKRPGREASRFTEIARDVFRDQSPRTQARFARALRMARLIADNFDLDFDAVWAEAHKAAVRPNGSMNFTVLLQSLEDRAAMLIAGAGADHAAKWASK